MYTKIHGDLMTSPQQMEAVVFQLKDQIRGDRRSFEENKQRMANENKVITNEKNECMKQTQRRRFDWLES